MTVANGIEAGIITAIDAMTTGTGYRFAYDNVNQYKPTSRTYPSVQTTFGPEISRGNTNVPINTYAVDRDINLRVEIGTSTDVNSDLDKILEDFKRLFSNYHVTFRGLGVVDTYYIQAEKFFTNVRAVPGYINMTFRLYYRVVMDSPNTSI